MDWRYSEGVEEQNLAHFESIALLAPFQKKIFEIGTASNSWQKIKYEKPQSARCPL